jgi:hypothetical protein
VPGVDRGDAQADQGVTFARPGGADHHQILLFTNPFQTCEVVESLRGDRGRGHRERVQCLGDGEPGGLESVDDVGRVAGGQFGLDESAQYFLGGPALCLGCQ